MSMDKFCCYIGALNVPAASSVERHNNENEERPYLLWEAILWLHSHGSLYHLNDVATHKLGTRIWFRRLPWDHIYLFPKHLGFFFIDITGSSLISRIAAPRLQNVLLAYIWKFDIARRLLMYGNAFFFLLSQHLACKYKIKFIMCIPRLFLKHPHFFSPFLDMTFDTDEDDSSTKVCKHWPCWF